MKEAKSFLVFAVVFLCAQSLVNNAQAQVRFSTLVIDAGHGGKDSGALGKNSQEKDIVLDVALRFGKMVNDSFPEVKTIFTRSDDTFIPLNDRATIANKNNADLFISIHANWVKNTDITGAETFVLGLHRSKENLEVAQKENSVITFEDDYTNTYEGFDPTQPESYIIFELMQNTYLEQSITLAAMVQEGFVGVGRDDRGVRQAGFLVLRQTSMPSVLIELGFLSNLEEEAYMMSEKGKAELTESIFQAFSRYKKQYDHANESLVLRSSTPIRSDDEGIWFRVQIATTSKPLEKVDDSFGEVFTLNEDGRYKYMVCRSETYAEAQENLKSVKKKYPDSFIVAFEDGKKLSVKAARKKTEK